ncbi:MAG: hypothetical protein SGILL_006689 [Bacillariaceae sp.]
MAQTAAERIYVGGLDPPRLSPSEILKRLKAIAGIQISPSSTTLEDSKPYLHIEAVSKDPTQSALSIVAKQYHNVKWKGCKLVVEAARPHFLERLEGERKDRAVLTETALEVENDSLNVSSHLPRRLRVRKKFGDEAFHVDTKPWLIEDWSGFQTARDKLEKRAERHHEKQLQKPPQKDGPRRPSVLLHRAVHIRFQSGAMAGDGQHQAEDESEDAMLSEVDTASSEDESSSSSSESENEEQASNMQKPYDWSDSDAEDGGEEEELGDPTRSVSQTNASKSDTSASDTESSNNKKATIPEAEQHSPSDDKLPPKGNTYGWSSDEDSSDDDEINELHAEKSAKPWKSVELAVVDEFAAGLDGDDGSEANEMVDSLDENANETTTPPSDLKDDVATNLGILSSLFPGMETIEPAAFATGKTLDATLASKGEASWERAATIMPRYDPSKETNTGKVEPENVDADETKSSTDSSSSDDGSIESTSEAKHDDNKDSAAPIQESVYEEAKLESVFRDARDTWDQKLAPSAPKLSSASNEQQSSGAFTFGFDVGDSNSEGGAEQKELRKPKEESSGFSFSFDLPADAAEPVEETSKQPHGTGDVEAQSASIESELGVSRQPRRQGLNFPAKALSRYAGYFFDIDENPQASRNDPPEVWNRTRHTLTMDWKRKRKYAMSRIQKRLRSS